MSAYSDWKCGAIDDEEYSFYSAWEARRDKFLESKMYDEYPCDEQEEGEDTNDAKG